ncbi:hypothetical protein [uncultured Jatrophihabitans sp.]|uniref:hypothetical protein n=1 Tax=uncultured Jatrophihabitans sp. TaxID=1610747 RepID=UPI0035CA7218
MQSGWRSKINTTLSGATGYRVTKAPVTKAAAEPRRTATDAPVRVVVATTLDLEDFHERSDLGRSLASIPTALRPELTVYAGNRGATVRGLPGLYNEALESAAENELLVLVHDDVHLHDWYLAARAREAMARFDVAGIAGAVRSDPADPSWYFTFGPDLTRGPRQPAANLSGSVNHGPKDAPKVQVYGRAPAACALLDGVLLIVHAGRARAAGVRFDEQFRFHLYDLDFCRTARRQGLRLGTWPISITHGSRGAWDSEAFTDAAQVYLTKWAS